MPWHDDGAPVPPRSDEELLTVVRTKATAIRHRRLQIMTGAVAGLVVVLGCLVVASRQGDDGATSITMASPGTASTLAGGDAFSSAESLPPTTPEGTTSVPAAVPAPDGSPRVVAPSGSPNQPVPAPADNQAFPPAEAPPPEPVARCLAPEIVTTVVTDRSVYAVGSDVKITVTARNQSSHPCARPTTFSFEFADGAGNPILGGAGHEDWLVAPPPPLQPGETVTYGETWTGTAICDGACHPAPPGTYRVNAAIGGYAAVPASFTISG